MFRLVFAVCVVCFGVLTHFGEMTNTGSGCDYHEPEPFVGLLLGLGGVMLFSLWASRALSAGVASASHVVVALLIPATIFAFGLFPLRYVYYAGKCMSGDFDYCMAPKTYVERSLPDDVRWVVTRPNVLVGFLNEDYVRWRCVTFRHQGYCEIRSELTL